MTPAASRAPALVSQPGAGKPGPRTPPPTSGAVDLEGPRVRLGVLWAMVLLPALFAGPVPLAAVLAPVCGLAAVQASRSWRRNPAQRPIDAAAGAGAVCLVIGAAFGPVGLAVGAATATAIAAGLHQIGRARHRARRVSAVRHLPRTLLVAAACGVAGAGPVLLRSASGHGAVPALALCTYALAYDASAFLVGAAATHPWEAPLAGAASIAAVTVAVAAILVPPFRGASPWAVGAVAAATAPLGPWAASALLGDADVAVAALRRIDTFIALGPACALVALAAVG
jgi:hypothetical protein